MAAGYCYCLGINSNAFFLKDNKKAFILGLNVPKVTAYIGCNTWIANGCRIMKNTMVPDNTVIAAYTVLAGKVDAIEKTVIGNDHQCKVLARERWLDMDDQEIFYE